MVSFYRPTRRIRLSHRAPVACCSFVCISEDIESICQNKFSFYNSAIRFRWEVPHI